MVRAQNLPVYSPESALAVASASPPSSTYDHDLSLRFGNRGRSGSSLQSPLLQTSPSNDRGTAGRGHGRGTLRSWPNPRHNGHGLFTYIRINFPPVGHWS